MTLVAVAGCLFEIHLDREPGAGHWEWTGGQDDGAVTLVAAHLPNEPAEACRLRFRAERPGPAWLAFTAADGQVVAMAIRIAPESE